MKRMTKKIGEHYTFHDCDIICDKCFGGCKVSQRVMDEYGELEDLLEGTDWERLKELIETDREHRIITLPCPVGSEYYTVDKFCTEDGYYGELQKFCQNTKMCSQECPFVNLCDKIWEYNIPSDWKLASIFTEQDRNDAHKVREMFCRDGRLYRQGKILTFSGTAINNTLFPGLADGEQTCLKEILEGEHAD